MWGGSKRRVIPLHVQTDESAAQRSLVPPTSPLHANDGGGGGGLERMLLLRNMNVGIPLSGVDGPTKPTSTHRPVAPTTAPLVVQEDVSAAHNLKERKRAEARRRVEVQLMTLEDYTNTPEGAARLERQRERACMHEEELRMQRAVQDEQAQRRARERQRQADEEARIKEMYLAKRRQEMEEQARVAHEKEVARKQLLEAKMKALKDEADRKAREEYVKRQQQLADEAQAVRDVRTAAMEMTLMTVEDELASVYLIAWLAEEERQRQIDAEAREWKAFEEREAQRQREETQKRRDAQKEQYEQDRAWRMQIHKLQQDRVRTAAADKRRRDHEQHGEGVSAATSLERLRSQCEQPADVLPMLLPPPSSPSASDGKQSVEKEQQLTSRRAPTPSETARAAKQQSSTKLVAIVEQTLVPPPPALQPQELQSSGEKTATEEVDAGQSGNVPQDGSEPPTSPTAPPEQETAPDDSSSAEKGGASPNDAVVPLDAADEKPPACEPPREEPVVIQSEMLRLSTLRSEGVMPVAEVLSVTTGSPSSDAGLGPRDLLIEFGGITSATPKCIVAIAECVQQNVNQRIALVVLRPVERPADDNSDGETWVHRCELSLVPHKWKGKGLLGCQLSPFKWPTNPVSSTAVESSPPDSQEPVTSSYDALVLHQVQADSLADRLGLLDGDVLARCGDLDVSQAGSSASDALAAVAMDLQLHWRDAKRELPLVLQRWDESAQSYTVLRVVLPVSASGETLGCQLTTYSQYYYPSTTSASVSACDECYATPLASSLHAAALSGHVSCLQALIASCSPEFLDWRDDEGRSPLFYACYASQVDAVKCLVTQLKATTGEYDPVSGADAYGDSPLHAAASSDCVDAVAYLLETRFIRDVDIANTATQATAAHVAGSEATLRMLHDRFRADLLALDADGRMPLFYACLRNDPASVAFLCALHPDFADYADSAGGNTPLHMAAWCGFGDVVQTLVAALPSIALFVPNQDGLDARTLAAQSGWHALADTLERLMAHE